MPHLHNCCHCPTIAVKQVAKYLLYEGAGVSYLGMGRPIVHIHAITPGRDKTAVSKGSQVHGDVRLAYPNQFGKLVHRALTVGNQVQQLQAHRMREGFTEFCLKFVVFQPLPV